MGADKTASIAASTIADAAMPAHAPSMLRERLAGWIDHLEHILPAQAPIRNFVHHNTLHGLQHLPFREALAEAARLTGARPWASEVQCRAWLAEGRITVDDLDAAFTAVFGSATESSLPAIDLPLPGWPGICRRQVLHHAFRHDLQVPTHARVAWLLQETGALERWQAGVDAVGRPEPPGTFLPALWAACADCLAANHGNEADEVDDADWRQHAPALWPELLARLGREWTLSNLLAGLTGDNPALIVQPLLIRQLAAHLDQGVAGWRNPHANAGFYAAWRSNAVADWGWELDELLAARQEIALLPADPVDTIARELQRLCPDEARWETYLERLALDLPGWSGMVLRHDRHGAGNPAGTPVSMTDYLAVRLVLERLCCEDLVRRTWGLPMELSRLGRYFIEHPAELWVRHARFSGRLGEVEAHEAQCLIDGEGEAGDWEHLADRANAAARARGIDRDRRWPLFVLAQHLGIDADTLRAAGPAAAQELLAASTLDANLRGHVWLLAYEGNYRQQVFAALAANHDRRQPALSAAPAAQLVFCMDDREEGTRRHLEEVNPAIQTFGAAGFFGVPMFWRGLDDDALTALCPVVVTPQNVVHEVERRGHSVRGAMPAAQHAARRAFRREWQDRLHGATRDTPLVAPFLAALAAPPALAAMIMQTLAPARLGECWRSWRKRFEGVVPTRLALTADVAEPASADSPRAGFSDAEQIERVAGFLVSIGLTDGFAPLVVIVGHGSNSANNPHAAAYDCGACSGRHGGPNARAFAAMANRPAVRAGLVARGILVPAGCWFLGVQHNTCDESLTWFDLEDVPDSHCDRLASLARDLEEATRRHAVERCRRFASAPVSPGPALALQHLAGRRHDWSQARPELGHATVAAAFIGRRAMSRGAFFDRRVFLISYDPLADDDGRVLESILLAAGPVGAGISLEYYFSTVDNERFGCGSKITHNLAGLVGVMEGTTSDLRTGLPRQMIEIHEPMRLLVILEQRREVVAAIYERQPPLRELIGLGWINLAVKEPESDALFDFDPVRGWLPWQDEGRSQTIPRAASSADWFVGHDGPLPPALLEMNA